MECDSGVLYKYNEKRFGELKFFKFALIEVGHFIVFPLNYLLLLSTT